MLAMVAGQTILFDYDFRRVSGVTMISSFNSLGGLSAAEIAALFGSNASSQTSTPTSTSTPASTTAAGSTMPGAPVPSTLSEAASAIQYILAKAQLNNAAIATLGGASSVSGSHATAPAQMVSSASLVSVRAATSTGAGLTEVDTVESLSTGQAAGSSALPSASLSSALSTTTQTIFDGVTALAAGGLVVAGQAASIDFATLALTTSTKTDSGATSETASVAAGALAPSTMSWLQTIAMENAQVAAQPSQDQSQTSSSASSGISATDPAGSGNDSGSAQAAQSAIMLSIRALSPGAFTLGETQAKQLVSAYEVYLGQSGSTTGAGFSFYETYSMTGCIGVGSIEIDGVVTSASGDTGLSSSIGRQQTSDGGWEGFLIPLSTAEKS